jgi:hypothetical protein
MSLLITEFGMHVSASQLIASQVVAVGSAAAESAALNARTQLVRLFAEEDCSVAIGASADAETDATIALAANTEFVIGVHAESGFVVSVVDRLTVSGGGTVEADGVTAVERAYGPYRQTVLTCVDTPIDMLDEAGVGQYGSAHLYTFPEGVILFQGAVLEGDFTGPASFINTFAGDFALGVSAVVDKTTGLVGGTNDLCASTPIGPAVAKVAAMSAVEITAGAMSADGTTTPAEAHLNFIVDDNAAHAAGEATFNGTITLTWMYLGDTAP